MLRKSFLVSSLVFLLISLLTVMAGLPLRVHAVPEIYIMPSDNPPYPGPYLGFKWNITIWLKGYGTPPVWAWEVRLNYDVAAGINITRVWAETLINNPAYIFYGKTTCNCGPPTVYAGTVVAADILLFPPAASPPPDPAKLAIIEFEITDAPGKFEEFHTDLEIANEETYLLDDTMNFIPVTRTGGSYTYARLWDITGTTQWIPDGKCDIRDVAIVAVRFGSEDGDEKYDSRADITGPTYLKKDGKIDIRDISLVGIHFGEEY